MNKIDMLQGLIKKYADLADFHGVEAVVGPRRDRIINRRKEKEYDILLIHITKSLIKEVSRVRRFI